MYLTLIRDTATQAFTMGTLEAGGLTFQSIERPWVDAPPGLGGAHGISCVPAGLYELVLHDSDAHPKSFALVNPDLDVWHEPGDVPSARLPYARTTILLHPANRPCELQGCCALGMTRGIASVLESRLAFDRFNLVVPWQKGHSLLIEYAGGVTP